MTFVSTLLSVLLFALIYWVKCMGAPPNHSSTQFSLSFVDIKLSQISWTFQLESWNWILRYEIIRIRERKIPWQLIKNWKNHVWIFKCLIWFRLHWWCFATHKAFSFSQNCIGRCGDLCETFKMSFALSCFFCGLLTSKCRHGYIYIIHKYIQGV